MDNKPRQWQTDEIALMREITASIWARLEKARAEEALRKSEEKYRTLFNSIDEGVTTVEVLFDHNGKAVDILYLEQTAMSIKLTGLDLVGKKASEALSGGIESQWMDQLTNVALTGKPLRTEYHVKNMGWFSTYFARVGGDDSRKVISVFSNITERKKEEQRQAYLFKISDALRSLSDAVEIEEVVTREAMNHFKANRCYYCEIKNDSAIILRDAHTEGLPSVAAVYPLSSFAIFKAAIDAGKPFIVNDIYTTDLVDEPLKQICIGLQIFSYILVPVVKQGNTVGLLCLTQTAPRQWTETEKELVIETAERTWASVERARAEKALRQSEEQLSAVFKASPIGLGFINTEGEMVFSNDEMRRFLPTNIIPSKDDSRYMRWIGYDKGGNIVERNNFPSTRALRGETVVPGIIMLYTSDTDQKIWTRVSSVPIKDNYKNIIGAITCVTDINDIKKAEETLKQSADKYLNQLENEVQQRTEEIKNQLTILQHTEELARTGSWEYETETESLPGAKACIACLACRRK